MQISQCEYEPINRQPHFMRLQLPNCFVSAANYFWEMFLHIEKESAIRNECTAKQKFSSKHTKGRDHIFCMLSKLPQIALGPWILNGYEYANGGTILKFDEQIELLAAVNNSQGRKYQRNSNRLAFLLTH